MTISLTVPDILVARAKAGDLEALEALYRAFETPVYNLARRICRAPEDAEDVVQETFLEVVKSIRHYRGEGHLWGWIRQIAASKALMRLRREKLRATDEFDRRDSRIATRQHRSADRSGARLRAAAPRRPGRWCGCTTSKATRTRRSPNRWARP